MGAWRPKHVEKVCRKVFLNTHTVSSLIWRSEDPPATITTCTGGCRVSIFTPDDGRMTPETCRESLQEGIPEYSYSFVPNMAKWGSTCNHNYLYLWLPCQYFILLIMGAWRPKHVVKVCSNKICILLHHVGVLFNLKNLSLLLGIDILVVRSVACLLWLIPICPKS